MIYPVETAGLAARQKNWAVCCLAAGLRQTEKRMRMGEEKEEKTRDPEEVEILENLDRTEWDPNMRHRS